MSQTAENLAYLLWKEKADRSTWAGQISTWAGCSHARAEELLLGEPLHPAEQARIAAVTRVEEQDLQYVRLLEQDEVDILWHNLAYLFDSVQHGDKKELAERMGVHPTTISKWLNRISTPSPERLRALKEAFGIPSKVDLTAEPLFLSIWPIAAQQQRHWLHERIDQLDPETLTELFPAFRRLLADG